MLLIVLWTAKYMQHYRRKNRRVRIIGGMIPHIRKILYHTLETICTTEWSTHVTHRGRYMYQTVVNKCTAQ